MTETTIQEKVKLKDLNADVNTDKSKYQTTCPECKEVLPRGSFFCPQCDPPGIPEESSLGGLSGFQAFLRIGVILALFLAIAFHKLDLSIDNFMQAIDPGTTPPASNETYVENNTPLTKDDDFAITNFINVNHANIRSEPSTTATVIAKADKGEVVKLLERREKWSQIEIKGKKGWVSNGLLSSEIR